MTTVLDIQQRLKELGYDPGPQDGLLGPSTLGAMALALGKLEGAPRPPVPEGKDTRIIPKSWMPWAQMQRIVWHWTAGTHRAGKSDLPHYHLCIEGGGALVRGNHPISANSPPIHGAYAAHTRNCNSGSIGVALCGMSGAKESPFNAGKWPINQTQWAVLAEALADLCERYSIPITKGSVLSHAEVQQTLGIRQAGKWDTARLPWEPSMKDAVQIGDQMRLMVRHALQRTNMW